MGERAPGEPYRYVGKAPQNVMTPEQIEAANVETRLRLSAILGRPARQRGQSEEAIRTALREWIEPLYGVGREGGGRDLGDRMFAVVVATDRPDWAQSAGAAPAWQRESSRPSKERADAVAVELASACSHYGTSRVADDETARWMIAVSAFYVDRAWKAHQGIPLERVRPWKSSSAGAVAGAARPEGEVA